MRRSITSRAVLLLAVLLADNLCVANHLFTITTVEKLSAQSNTRGIQTRLSSPPAVSRCPIEFDLMNERGVRVQCGFDVSYHLIDPKLDSAVLGQLTRGYNTSDALHTQALRSIVLEGTSDPELHQAINDLGRATRMVADPAPMLADLAAAYLLRARRDSSARDLLKAVELSEQAIELQPRNQAAHYNLALALEQLGLEGEADKTRERYLLIDPHSDWAVQAMLDRETKHDLQLDSRRESEADSIVLYFASKGDSARLASALLLRASTRLAIRKRRGAVDDLERSTAILAHASAHQRSAALMTLVGDLRDKMVMLDVAENRPVDALIRLERTRISLGVRGQTNFAGNRKLSRVPSGTVVIEYAASNDELFIWTLADSTVRFTRLALPRELLHSTIRRVRASLERRERETAVRPGLQALHHWLIDPIKPYLGPPGTPIVIIPNGVLEGVPFSALYDSKDRAYLIERHPLRFSRTLDHAVRERRSQGSASDTALLVSDPAFDLRSYPGLPRLPGAQAEVDSISAVYKHSKVLRGVEANITMLLASLQSSRVLHFAGHAVFDSTHPDRSYLIFARPRRGTRSGRLSSHDIEAVDLRNIRLAVLSSCQTYRAWDKWAGGLPGPADALLNAGVDGVVGSLWQVDDALTRSLMIQFHRAYRETGSGAQALVTAQRHLLGSNNPSLRTPAAWAGFRYTGI